MSLTVEAKFHSDRPDGVWRNPLNSPAIDWEDTRTMYMRYAPDAIALVPRIWIPWLLDKMRKGDIGGVGMALNWMYGPGMVKDLQLTPGQIHAVYNECFKRAVPNYLNAAKEGAEKGHVTRTWDSLEDAKVCASKVNIDFDEDNAAVLRRQSVMVALPKTLELTDQYSQRPVRNLDDYDQLLVHVGRAKRYAKYLGVDITRRIAVPEHRVIFQRSYWYPASMG